MSEHHATAFPDPTPVVWAELNANEKAAAVQALTGMTASAMAEILGTTKNAVISVASRRNIALLADNRRLYKVEAHPALKPGREVAPETWDPLGPPTASPTRNQCCWPVGPESGSKQMFCGLPKARGSYCDAHATVAFRPAAPVQYLDGDEQNALLRYIRDSEIKETARVAFGRVRAYGEGEDE